jgi:hypothetical protein
VHEDIVALHRAELRKPLLQLWRDAAADGDPDAVEQVALENGEH